MRNSTRFLTAIILLIASNAAFAHPGHNVSGLAAGLMHPFMGLDHLLAMVAVGLWAVQSSANIQNVGHKIWLLPTTFMAMLAVGAGIAMQWQSLPMVEDGIAVSVLALGLLVSLSLQLPTSLSIAVTALFGLLHGYAHGLELPGSAAPVAYGLGFIAATISLLLCGIVTGLTTRLHYALLSRLLGGAIAISGAFLLASAGI